MRPNTKKRHAARITTRVSDGGRVDLVSSLRQDSLRLPARDARATITRPCPPASLAPRYPRSSGNPAAPGIISSLLLPIVRVDFLGHFWIDRRFRAFALPLFG